IIGCGNIAGGFDKDLADTDGPCTHAGAYRRDGRYTLKACVDPDPQQGKAFQQDWQVDHYYETLAAIPQDEHFDIISICSPSACHYADMQVAITKRPKLIFCEKPITQHIAHTRELITQCKQHNIGLMVNYTRRWDPDIRDLKIAIEQQHYGQLRSVIGIYNKGIFHNGSHLVNTLTLLLGQLRVHQVLPGIADYHSDDPSINALLTGNISHRPIPVHFVTANAQDYTLFEIHFIFQNRSVIMYEGGLYWSDRLLQNSDRFTDYRTLDHGRQRPGRYPQAMLNALDNIYQFINVKQTLLCTGDDALATQALCATLYHQAQNNVSPSTKQSIV
ncbi:MAG: Gfo/Idh/MocA family oxidoreductase, partial [Pseudomonadota bacterium]